ncbi:GNAT family N-acetyltransferase [Planococcus sp. CPCC 101016]|uniref:GNAT family N-acetyltransferase n=1 Tax=Planococcus sp. CPCC 101016 TaxID=2599617 RepID=UPI0011B6B9BB|nr:GNAT family N-acetyltransferase [Planococcus sp. CPCC 101016]TWT04157.1 GNAT family N-acetyltransferase [Planococcus sp. CPCC 101016]
MDWKTYHFEELTARKLYEVLKLRVDVFVVEQNCPYPELDNLDQQSVHLLCSENDEVLAYARLVPAGIKYNLPSIGRVIVHESARGRGLAKKLLEQSIEYILEEWQAPAIQLQGQVYLQGFYESFGFQTISDSYDEDGIPHVDMKFTRNQM